MQDRSVRFFHHIYYCIGTRLDDVHTYLSYNNKKHIHTYLPNNNNKEETVSRWYYKIYIQYDLRRNVLKKITRDNNVTSVYRTR